MRKLMIVSMVMFLFCSTSAVLAQDKTPDVGWVYMTTPKSGMVKQMEEGRKRHMDFHRKQNDTWTWLIWQIETGDATGAYYSTSFGHSWHDLDAWESKMGTADTADGAVNLAPYGGTTTASIWMVMKDSSRPSSDRNPPKLAEINHFLLKPGTDEEFTDNIHKINDAINKMNWGLHYTWYQLQDGGEGPHYVLAIDMNSWADLAGPEIGFPEMLEKAVGRRDADYLRHSFDKMIKRSWTETIRYRPDLSYVPGSR
ncbi:MAG: hypothetical protein JOY93_07315 [Acidobacteriales bacterium]|nr:hypothetical protein [Terriglobales bacterium]